MRRLLFAVTIAVAIGALMTSACGDSPNAPTGSGTLTLHITDTPYQDAAAFVVTFTEVRAHRSGEGWIALPFAESAASRTCDLKRLVGADDVLGVGALPAGHYTQIRLQLSEATLYFDERSRGPACVALFPGIGGRSAPVQIPSGTVHLNREFDLENASATTILIDFDGNRSIHEAGNGRFMMRPVIDIVSVR